MGRRETRFRSNNELHPDQAGAEKGVEKKAVELLLLAITLEALGSFFVSSL